MPLPFVGVDGEGGNDSHGRHHYTMLRAGNEYTTSGWLPWLLHRPKKCIYVAYFFDYDVTMMLKDAPEDVIRSLVQTTDAIYGPYTLHYRPRKEFTIRGHGTRTTVSDVGTFFQCRFVDALERWDVGTPELRARIESGKEQRNTFGELQQSTVEYNHDEVIALQELMDKFRRACTAIGYLPRAWQGPGQLAKAMLKTHGIPKSDELPEPNLAGIWEAAQAAYYGGRFETSAVGPIPGPVDAWDINSAYPYATTLLPCLAHTSWRPSKTIEPTGIYRVHYTHPEQMWYTLPHRRKDGSICYPRTGSGWYWGIELLAAQSMDAKLTLRHGFSWEQNCNHRLFDFMHRLYSVRKAIGKTQAGLALKLAMNSVYGVTAQSVGRAPYANPVYAGLITSHTRAALLRAMAPDPTAVYMLATDGLFSVSGALPLTASENLGGWDRKEYESGIFIVQPGVYFLGDSGTSIRPKTRGVPYQALVREREALQSAWNGNRSDSHTVSLRQFIGLRLAAARNRLDTAGEWVEVEKTISYDWTTKRRADATHVQMGGPSGGVGMVYRTLPYDASSEPESTPYDRVIGPSRRDMDRLEWMDAPDWAERISDAL